MFRFRWSNLQYFKNNYEFSKPIKKNINKINSLYKEGFKIIIFTARYMGRSKENVKTAHKKGFKNE